MIIVLIIIAILVVGSGAYYYGKYKQTPAQNGGNNSTGTPSSGNNAAQWTANRAPAFQDFPVSEIFNGPNAAPDFSSQPSALEYKTRVTNGFKESTNFAGHYRIIDIGCGSNCGWIYILDLKNGKILGSNPDTSNGYQSEASSSLLITYPDVPPNPNMAPGNWEIVKSYFVIENGTITNIYAENCLVSGGKQQNCTKK